jgi:hypothetical protein
MTFSRDEVAALLVVYHRRCCICHRFCGFKVETDHINPKAEGGSDDIGNAIPVCCECHFEIRLYDPAHPPVVSTRPKNCAHVVISGLALQDASAVHCISSCAR